MISSLCHFEKFFPDELKELFKIVRLEHFVPVLVGGSVRDLLKYEIPSKDLDVELRYRGDFSPEEWQLKMQTFRNKLADNFQYQVEDLPFSMFRVTIGYWTVEFSSPRIEIFNDGDLGHKNFTAELLPNIPYREAFARRDFTLNAIGVEFGEIGSEEEYRFVDPFMGVLDLKAKVLRPCGENFYRDPVRFLRAIRFRLKHGFKFSKKLVDELKKMDLTELSTYYFFSEFFKYGELQYFSDFFTLVELYDLNINSKIREFAFLGGLSHKHLILNRPEIFLRELVFNQVVPENSLDCLCLALKLKKNVIKDLLKLKEMILRLKGVDFELQRNKYLDLEVSELVKDPIVQDLGQLYKLIRKLDSFSLSGLVSNSILLLFESLSNREVNISPFLENAQISAENRQYLTIAVGIKDAAINAL